MFVVALHLQLSVHFPASEGTGLVRLLGIEAAVLVAVIAAEQLTLVVAGRRYGQPSARAS